MNRAAASYESAIVINSFHPSAFYNLGVVYMDLYSRSGAPGYYHSATVNLDVAVQKATNNPLYPYQAGRQRRIKTKSHLPTRKCPIYKNPLPRCGANFITTKRRFPYNSGSPITTPNLPVIPFSRLKEKKFLPWPRETGKYIYWFHWRFF